MFSSLHACVSGSGLELKDIRPLATVGVKSITSFAITLVAEPATAHHSGSVTRPLWITGQLGAGD